jgi:hypothetical protein
LLNDWVSLGTHGGKVMPQGRHGLRPARYGNLLPEGSGIHRRGIVRLVIISQD